jgi:hypothetical protein
VVLKVVNMNDVAYSVLVLWLAGYPPLKRLIDNSVE